MFNASIFYSGENILLWLFNRQLNFAGDEFPWVRVVLTVLDGMESNILLAEVIQPCEYEFVNFMQAILVV